MLNSTFKRFMHAARVGAQAIFACMVVFALLPSAFAQDFTLQASPPNPSSVNPGVSSLSNITISSLNGFNSPVALSCAVTPLQTNGATCLIQASATPPATAVLTVNTTTATPATLYQITVTGTAPSETPQTVTVNVTVLAVTPEYTITVTTPMTPSSVLAGSGATAGITITPIKGYNGNVTLSCSAITPTVLPSPVCSFNPATVPITTGTAQTSTLTVTTTGPASPTTSILHPRIFYAMWLPLPGLALIGACFGPDRHRKKAFSGLMLLGLMASILFVPACGGSHNTSSNNSGVTPNNSYSFTLTGGDENAIAPSNGTQTVSLTVN